MMLRKIRRSVDEARIRVEAYNEQKSRRDEEEALRKIDELDREEKLLRLRIKAQSMQRRITRIDSGGSLLRLGKARGEDKP